MLHLHNFEFITTMSDDDNNNRKRGFDYGGLDYQGGLVSATAITGTDITGTNALAIQMQERVASINAERFVDTGTPPGADHIAHGTINQDGSVTIFVPDSMGLDHFYHDDEAPCPDCNKYPCVLDDIDPDLSQDQTLNQYFFTLGNERTEQSVSNKEIRYEMYRIASRVLEGMVGKGNRRKLPDCVTSAIKDAYPEASGKYVGFKTSDE